MSNGVSRIHHVGIVVQDLKASLSWYQEHLGFTFQYGFSMPGTEVAMIVRGEARLELFQVDGASPVVSERKDVRTLLNAGGVNHLAFSVKGLDDLVSSLSASGVEIAIPPSTVPSSPGDRFAYIRDNEGTFVELFEPAESRSSASGID